MVRVTSDYLYIKIVYWGTGGCGKTTILETLYQLTRENQLDIIPTSSLTKISRASGATLYFDRGLFQSVKQKKIFYQVYTVAGQHSFTNLRKRVYEGADGIIFVVNSETQFFEDNIESLKEIKMISKAKLIKDVPLIIMLNKKDLKETINEEDIRQILKDEGLWYPYDNPLSFWNPIIFDTVALWDKNQNIYKSFLECARRTVLYHIYGDGKAPMGKEVLKEISESEVIKQEVVPFL